MTKNSKPQNKQKLKMSKHKFNEKMLDKITKIHQNPKKKAVLSQNEVIYDTFLSNLFTKFDSNKNNAQFYDTVFSSLYDHCYSSSKGFSYLKHYCYDLMNLLQKTSDTINRISTTYNDMMIAEDAVYNKIGFKIDTLVKETRNRMIGGLNEWASEVLSVKTFVNDDMASFFHFKKHENLELYNLMYNKIQLTSDYNKRSAALDKLKQKLYNAKDMTKWKVDVNNIPGDFNEMYTNFQLIRPHMLPEVKLLGH